MSFIENPTTVAATAAEGPTRTGGSSADGSDKDDVTAAEVTAAVAEATTGGGRLEEAQGVTFLYRLVVGQAHRSYGLNVARAAGMDEDMIQLAARKSAEMRDR